MEYSAYPTARAKEMWAFAKLSSVGRQVKKFRSMAGLSQEELSGRCDIYRTYLSRIEGGEANPTAVVLMTLANNLNVSVGDLFNESPPGP
jgi:transcriptional regulator with XRE-family HTH domain